MTRQWARPWAQQPAILARAGRTCCNWRRLRNLDQLQAKARDANRRLLTIQRVGQGCAIETATFERISQPSVEEGQRTGTLKNSVAKETQPLAGRQWPDLGPRGIDQLPCPTTGPSLPPALSGPTDTKRERSVTA
jgi:hypothetical protein